jgi:Cytochrome bd terminal oxidase subunit II
MTFVWFALILLCLLMYVTLDGWDLGIGIATLFERDGRRRRQMLELVAVAWDGNETWLVLSPGRAFGFGWLLAFAAGGAVLALVTLRPGSRYDVLPTATGCHRRYSSWPRTTCPQTQMSWAPGPRYHSISWRPRATAGTA